MAYTTLALFLVFVRSSLAVPIISTITAPVSSVILYVRKLIACARMLYGQPLPDMYEVCTQRNYCTAPNTIFSYCYLNGFSEF